MPAELCGLTSLGFLILQNNILECQIPSSITNLESLLCPAGGLGLRNNRFDRVQSEEGVQAFLDITNAA